MGRDAGQGGAEVSRHREMRSSELLPHEVREREAIAIESGVASTRAREIAECEARWREGAACTCRLHTTQAMRSLSVLAMVATFERELDRWPADEPLTDLEHTVRHWIKKIEARAR